MSNSGIKALHIRIVTKTEEEEVLEETSFGTSSIPQAMSLAAHWMLDSQYIYDLANRKDTKIKITIE